MKNIRLAILAVCLVALGSMAAVAQGWTNCTYDFSPDDCWGYEAIPNASTGVNNSAFGDYTLYSNTSGSYNTGTGYLALYSNTTSSYNTATGVAALYSNTTGENNAATGYYALFANTTGYENTAVGTEALYNSNGYENTALGKQALYNNAGGADNTATGYVALFYNTSGYDNVADGIAALFNNTTGIYNTASGMYALDSNTTGDYNIGVGFQAGYNVTGSYNIDIGSQGSSGDSDAIRIGTPGAQTSFYAAGVDGVTISSGVPVYINSSGQLGTVNSSIRYKEDVHDMADASSAIFQLRPVTYRYKQPYADGSKPIDYGLIAEEVAKIYPDLVVRSADGEIQTVQYQKLTPMLLNELQKQHQVLEQMEKTVDQQQQTIQLLKAQQTETVQILEKRLAALEAARPSATLEARVATQ
jgi:polyhydroxyalkanoate synthesis regulator phasin